MNRIRKVYLPLWVAWFSQLFILPIWGFAGYQVFFTEKGRAEMGLAGLAMITFVMAAVSVMLFLMGYRKLPAYIIEEQEN
jgi:hypothetical protein